MKQSTQNFCKLWESKGNVREAIKAQVQEDRFFTYAQALKSNSGIASLAKAGKESELTTYLKNHNGELNIPVRLTDRGIRRMSQVLVQMFKEG